MKKKLYTNPSERMPKILENSFAVRNIIKNLRGANFIDETNYETGEEFIYMLSSFGAVFHYEYFGRKPQVSLYGTRSNIEKLERALTRKFFAGELVQTTIK
jgi:hypothetical protein